MDRDETETVEYLKARMEQLLTSRTGWTFPSSAHGWLLRSIGYQKGSIRNRDDSIAGCPERARSQSTRLRHSSSAKRKPTAFGPEAPRLGRSCASFGIRRRPEDGGKVIYQTIMQRRLNLRIVSAVEAVSYWIPSGDRANLTPYDIYSIPAKLGNANER